MMIPMKKILEQNKNNIGLITFAHEKSAIAPISALLDIFNNFSDEIYLISGPQINKVFNKKVYGYSLRHYKSSNPLKKIFSYFILQLYISVIILKLYRKIDLLFFTLGGELLIVPIIVSKILRKKVFIIFSTSFGKVYFSRNDPFHKILSFLERINYDLSDAIIVKSSKIIETNNLERHKKKIYVAFDYFVNFEIFKIMKNHENRDSLIGFIGRLDGEKGIMNFVNSIPQLIQYNSKIRFLIIGEGELGNDVNLFLVEKDLFKYGKIIKWVEHYDIPKYLNELKVLVIPSYTETGPILALESMACGTPLLATEVGIIKNVIEDGKTGFILENNSSESIIKGVKRVLEFDDIDEIICKAEKLIKMEYNYEIVVGTFRKIFSKYN